MIVKFRLGYHEVKLFVEFETHDDISVSGREDPEDHSIGSGQSLLDKLTGRRKSSSSTGGGKGGHGSKKDQCVKKLVSQLSYKN